MHFSPRLLYSLRNSFLYGTHITHTILLLVDKFYFLSVILVKFSYFIDEETEAMRKNLLIVCLIFPVDANYLSDCIPMYKIKVFIMHVCAIPHHPPYRPHIDDCSLEVFFSD